MKAKEMFEVLEFETKENENFISYQKNWVGYICFDKKYRSIQTNFHMISIDVIKAITQQAKELGWI